jgi:uncharacterized metal-binding protein YceD (DUF177 family)
VLVDLRQYSAVGFEIHTQLPVEQYDLVNEGASGAVVLDLSCTWRGPRLRVQGQAKATFRLLCDRCLEPFTTEIVAPFECRFEPRPEEFPSTGSKDDEAALGLCFIDDESIDLGPAIRDALLLELPSVRRCRLDCPGLCPRCGEHRGTSCRCSPQNDLQRDNPFARFFAQRKQSQEPDSNQE